MVHLTTTESTLTNQLLDCLDAALADISEVEVKYANKTKIQKLLYLTIEEFDLPITYSWYLAGAVVPDRSIGPDSLNGPVGGPITPEEPPLSESSTDDRSDTEDSESPRIDPILFSDSLGIGEPESTQTDLTSYVDQDELIDFFKAEIPNIWREQTMRFLQNFYQEKAPEEYRLLYIESTHLRTHLAEMTDVVEAHLEGENPTRSITELRESLERSVSDFHYYLRQHKELKQTFDLVVRGTDLLEDALMMLDQRSKAEYTQHHVEILHELEDFIFFYVWKYPALLISQQTASGPSADRLRSEHAAVFNAFGEELRRQQSDIESKLEAADLLPGPDDFSPVDDEQMAKTLSDLSSAYLE